MTAILRLLTITVILAVGSTGSDLAHSASTPEVEASDEEVESSQEDEADSEESIPEPREKYVKPPEGKQQPWRLVRGLQILQDDIVIGKPRAEDAYKLLMIQLAKEMEKLDDSVWDHQRNLDALATYIILGGSTELGFKALQKTSLEKKKTKPLLTALAYAERDLKQARKLMTELDLHSLPLSMSAHFALAHSMVVSSTDLDMALKYLNEARRFAPGTLVEEAALRRAIRITGETKDFKYFRFLTYSYMRRFKKSHYFLDFLRNFSFTLVRMPTRMESELLMLLKETLQDMDMLHRVTVASYVARNSTISGKKMLSSWASEMALEQLYSESKLYARMKLYSAAIKIVQPEHTEVALEHLQSLSADEFDQVDKEILESARLLGQQILQDSSQSQQAALNDESVSMIDNNSILKRAEEVLSELEDVMGGKQQ